MDDSVFYEAVKLARAGRKTEARGLLQQVLTADPAFEMAWLWYADCASSDEERIQYLETGLRNTPNMPRVVAGLRALQRGKPADMGRTQPVFIGKPNGKEKPVPFYGLDDREPPAQPDLAQSTAPFLTGDLATAGADSMPETEVFTVSPEDISPDEFAAIERRTVSYLLKHPLKKLEDPWKSLREQPEVEPRPAHRKKDDPSAHSYKSLGLD